MDGSLDTLSVPCHGTRARAVNTLIPENLGWCPQGQGKGDKVRLLYILFQVSSSIYQSLLFCDFLITKLCTNIQSFFSFLPVLTTFIIENTTLAPTLY